MHDIGEIGLGAQFRPHQNESGGWEMAQQLRVLLISLGSLRQLVFDSHKNLGMATHICNPIPQGAKLNKVLGLID